MSRQYRDHGSLSGPDALPYAEAPRFSIVPTDTFTGPIVADAQRHADTACIAARRLDRQLDNALAHNLSAGRLAPVLTAARAARAALNDAIAKLERAPP